MSVEEQNHGTTQPPETPELPFPQPPPPLSLFLPLRWERGCMINLIIILIAEESYYPRDYKGDREGIPHIHHIP